MNASLGLGGRHALHAMRAGLELEPRKSPAADPPADDFLVAAMLAWAFAQGLHLPALRFGIAGVHAKQIPGEYGGLIAAGSGANLQEYVAVVLRVLRDQQALQLEFLGRDAGGEVGEFVLAHAPGREVLVRGQLVGNAQVAFERREAPIALDERTQP